MMDEREHQSKIKHSHSYTPTFEHIIHLDFIHHGRTVGVFCTGCRWSHEPTAYEEKHADPLLDVLKYHHWMHQLDILFELAESTSPIMRPPQPKEPS